GLATTRVSRARPATWLGPTRCGKRHPALPTDAASRYWNSSPGRESWLVRRRLTLCISTHRLQYARRERRLVLRRAHDRLSAVSVHSSCLSQVVRGLRVFDVHHQQVEKIVVSLRDSCDRYLQTLRRHQRAGRTRDS